MRILIVEDHKRSAELLVNLLQKQMPKMECEVANTLAPRPLSGPMGWAG